jgi:hypothetical protein
MPICTGGAVSQQKEGTARFIYMGGASLGALLNNIPTVWAVPFAALLASATYDLSTICSVDPPGFPTFTTQDLLVLTTPSLMYAQATSLQKWQDLITTALWYQFCECSSGTQPTQPAGPAAPAEVPSIGPGLSNTGPILPCAERQGSSLINTVPLAHEFTPWGDTRFHSNRLTLPAGTTQYQVKATSTVLGASHSSIDIYVNECSNIADTIGSEILLGTITSGGSATFTRTPGSGVIEVGAIAFNSPTVNAPNTDSLYYEVDVFCGNNPGTTISPCCPADQYVQGAIQQILQTVTLLQRHILPFAYIASTAHSGLHDQGSFSVNNLVGVKVVLTTTPASIGSELGEPTYYFDLGFLSVENTDGLIQQTRVTSTNQVWTPRLMSTAATIGYSFHPGVVATITELLAEP